MSSPARKKGYVAEVEAVELLKSLGWEHVGRTGSLNYTLNAPDIIARGHLPSVPLLMIKADRQGTLFVMSAAVLERLMTDDIKVGLDVQVKSRAKSWIHTVWAGINGR